MKTETEMIAELEKELLQQKEYQNALQGFTDSVEKADKIATKLSDTLLKHVMTEEGITLDIALLAAARSLMYLGRAFYDSKEEFADTLDHVRDVTASRISQAIDAPRPCMACEDCQEGGICQTPLVDEQMTFKAMPLVSCSIIEYALWTVSLNHAFGEE